MSAPSDLSNIFNEIDKDGDGYISYADLESSPYLASIFDNHHSIYMAFTPLHDKMNQKDFALLANAYRLKVQDFAIAKFQASKVLNKYLSVSAPGEAGPSIKQSYLRLTAHHGKQAGVEEKQHFVELELGVDKPQQEIKISELTNALGHPPHQVFLLLKFKTLKNGEQVAEKLQNILHQIVNLGKDLAPQFEQIFNMFKVYAKYSNGYTFLVIEIDNQFVDGIIDFANEVIQAISPECNFKFKAKIGSNVKHLLKENFDYTKSNGQINVEFDIDIVTMRKIKEIMGDNLQADEETPLQQIFMFLFEEFKLQAEFENLGEAIEATFQQKATEVTPYAFAQGIKEMNLKETIGQFFEGAPEFIDLLKESCQAEGELSLNFHDFFLRVNFDITVDEAFDLL